MFMKTRMIWSLAAVAASVLHSQGAAGNDVKVTSTWTMSIVPAMKAAPATNAARQENAPPADAPTPAPVAEPVVVEPMLPPSYQDVPVVVPVNQPVQQPVDLNEYDRIYQAIPFNRAEYNANPNYRHDSTMEILTGNARHQTIVKHSTVRRVPVIRTAPSALRYRNNYLHRGLPYYFYLPNWNNRGLYGF